jgi:transcriptional regulator with XRE-family HTH domain
LDPKMGPVAGFALRLRALREEAGCPGYRELARRTNYSVTTLSDAARGRELPSLEATLAYVTACGGDREAWEREWRAVKARIGSAARPDGNRPGAGAMEGDAEGEPPEAPETRRYSAWVVGAALVVGVVAGSAATMGVLWNLTRRPSPAAHAASSAWRYLEYRRPNRAAPGDAMDPVQTDCSSAGEVTSLDAAQVYLPDGSRFGELVLRDNPRCRVSWGRVAGPVSHEREVFVTARRPADHVATVSSYGGDSTSAYGWTLSTEPGCVYVEAFVRTPHGDGPTARTRCY